MKQQANSSRPWFSARVNGDKCAVAAGRQQQDRPEPKSLIYKRLPLVAIAPSGSFLRRDNEVALIHISCRRIVEFVRR